MEFIMIDEMEDDIGDFDAGGSTNSDSEKVDSILIKKILSEMKSEFNRGSCSVDDDNLKVELDIPASLIDTEDYNSKDSKDVPTVGNGSVTSETIETPAEITEIPSEETVEEVMEEGGEEESTDEKREEEGKVDIKEELNNSNTNGTAEFSESNTIEKSTLEDDDEDEDEEEEQKPRLVLTLRGNEDDSEVNHQPVPKKRTPRATTPKAKSVPDFPSPEENTERRSRRSLRNVIDKVEQDVGLKRSSRRMSKELTRESVLQSAIALKEKSFGSLNSADEKPHRRSLRLNDGDQKSSASAKSKFRSARFSQIENSDSSVTSSPNSLSKSGIGKVVKLVNDSTDLSYKVEVDDELDIENDAGVNGKSKPEVFPVQNTRKNNKVLKWSETDNGILGCSSINIEDLELKGFENISKINESSVLCKRKLEMEDEIGPGGKKICQYLKSPNIEEGSEPPGVADKLSASVMADSGGLCECQCDKGLYPSIASFTSAQYCKAIDSFETRLIGCCNSVDADTPLLRPSKTIPHQLFCDVHIQRLLRHNACPTCGLFCTQGIFKRCNNGHDYHKDCELQKDDIAVCPHCGCEDALEVKISLGAHKYPVFLPMQKPLNKFPSARMSFTGTTVEKEDSSELSSLVPLSALVLSSGRKITAEGIPHVEKEKLEKLLHVCSSQNDLSTRFSYRTMYQAAKNGDAEKMVMMLGSGMNPNQVMRDGGAVCALHAAASSGHLAIVHLLIQAGANTEVLDKEQNTPLMLAALNHHNDVVKYLVKAGASVSFKGTDGMTALHIAAKEGNLEACHHLLSSANSPQAYVDTVDDGRWTPLVWAAENCHTEVSRYLLEMKADPQIRDSEMNIALHWAAFAGSMEITEDLLNYGSNINLSNTHGDTPLHIAARQGAEDCIILLLSRGARVDMMNKAGHVPRDCVVDQNSYCYTAIDLNMQLRKLMVTTHVYPRILCNDISRGYETNPIQCVNSVDEEGIPTDFTYISENCLTTNINIDRRITSLTSCKCEDLCTGAGCLCAKISLRCWYDSKGKLLPDFNFEDPPMIFECNQTCNCNALTCKNRVVQRGIKVRLQLCKTRYKNWGVITLRDIPKGSYVCEYIGEIISDCEADTREDDSYLFDLDNRDGETYCIDARRYGNITRFINHSCRPNLLPVRIFVGHHDLHFPRIAFFANRDIAANEELGFDYGEKFWIIKCKSFTCKCATETCRYSETTIQQTLEKYKEKLKLEEVAV